MTSSVYMPNEADKNEIEEFTNNISNLNKDDLIKLCVDMRNMLNLIYDGMGRAGVEYYYNKFNLIRSGLWKDEHNGYFRTCKNCGNQLICMKPSHRKIDEDSGWCMFYCYNQDVLNIIKEHHSDQFLENIEV